MYVQKSKLILYRLTKVIIQAYLSTLLLQDNKTYLTA